ncbi:MAG: methionyl aminopeptidase [Clostridia bacterium]|jgi:methionyl aminopeptidase|nr:methionine aminopeptidase type [Clostridiales bacterium]MDK2985305.1 methionyl aminopeptidase [Clostridia bacterium]
MINIKSQRELEFMQKAGRIVAGAHKAVEQAVRPGVTTKELDKIAEEYIISQGAKPAFKGLYGFPASICTSINEQVVHGIPGLRKLKNGDIISIDIGAIIDGYNGDAARTIAVGEVDDKVKKLLEIAEQSLYEGIKKAVVGNRLSDISNAIQTFVESNGFSVVRDFVGHGIGRKMHEEPQVPNFGQPGRGPRLRHGMVLAIEPMVNMESYEVETLADSWTVVTKDGKPSAHFEHTVAVTDDGPQIFTTL